MVIKKLTNIRAAGSDENILLTPQTEWPKIAEEPATTQSIYTGYVMVLAAVAPVVTLIVSAGRGLAAAIFGYVIALAITFVLALIVEEPQHGFAIAKTLAEDEQLAQVITLSRPLVYRSLSTLVTRGLIRATRTEPGKQGRERTVYRATAAGSRVNREWLSSVVDHPRDARVDLLAKFVLRERRGLDNATLALAKADISEEVARFRGHVSHWVTLANAAEPCGRKLDFLLQEMNREVNTMGSKADGLRVSELIIAAKAELEKMREQVQNVE